MAAREPQPFRLRFSHPTATAHTATRSPPSNPDMEFNYMKSKTFPVTARALAVIAGVITIGACTVASSSGGTGGGTTTDASGGSDGGGDSKTVVDIITGKADTGDNPTADASTTETSGTSENAKCCAAKGAKCGYVQGCQFSCGGCPSGEKCDAVTGSKTINTCIKAVAAKPLKKNGEACGPNADCVVPANNASQAVKQAYYQCLNDQCSDGRCYLGVCSKMCKIATDKKDNASGAELPNGDGIEDPGATSECTDFVDGPAGKEFKCVDLFSPSDPNQLALCTPGTNFAPCKANSDCKNGEVCGYKQIRGVLAPTCMPPYKEVDGKAGTTLANVCNEDPKAGPVATCKNDLCLGIGCVDFCKTDDDCVTEVGACKAGKCGNGDACTKDADCSAWMCKKDMPFFGTKQPTVNVCLPKPCYLDEDCKNPAYYCLSGYNGVKNQDGDPDPKDPTKIKMPGWEESSCVKKAPNTAKKGEPCDDFLSDNDVTLKPCENKYWCMNGVCEGHCKTDSHCPANSKCGVYEIPLDTSDPQDQKYDVYTALKVCTPMPGATKECSGQGNCKDEAKAKYCKYYEVEMSQAATPTDYKYTMKGLCVEPDPKLGSLAASCGSVPAKNCNSGVCLATQNAQGQPQAGWCADACDSKADCGTDMQFEGFGQFKTKPYCRAIGWGNNATKGPLDNLYLSICYPDVSGKASLADCSADFKCASAAEACISVPIGGGPDKPMKTDFRCVSLADQQGTVPTKKVGASCNPDPANNAPEECASGLCMPDATTGQGYCSALCKDNAACGSNDSMFCDVDHQIIPRSDPKMAAVAPMCLKKKSCIPCSYDYQCATGTLCTWPDTKAEFGRCAPPCSTDADCAKTDGGGKCEAQVDANGKPTALKTCTPTNCK